MAGGQGAQHRYAVTAAFGGKTRRYRIGLRRIDLETGRNDTGQSFAFCLNGRDVSMQRANWIPVHTLPERATPDVGRDLLTSAREAA
ncbi:hypothetical protein EKE94_14415 [Mesobaculum littorinae]|uniref:Uncharacterized protein n=1 Tax=Mesobaculum littorinae TaxID=2486419 RepID=A0A438AES8_9RHOB|nr:hypothetical protein [Mesobaculum littorinae]RVV97211.1 hypothetical protein EKE94_14415 [Mesobaculum littorinae]